MAILFCFNAHCSFFYFLQRDEFTAFWHEHQYHPFTARNLILASMCPQIYGLYVVKLAVMLVLIGGVQVC